MNEVHNGRNMSASPVKILAVFIGMQGVQDTAPATVPPLEACSRFNCSTHRQG